MKKDFVDMVSNVEMRPVHITGIFRCFLGVQKMNKNVIRGLVAVGVLAGAMTSAHAVIDVTTVTAGITEAGVAILAVIAALLAMSVSIFGLAKAYGFIKRKAGA